MDTETHSSISDELPLDTTFKLLRDPRRRAVVSVLADREPPVPVPRLASAVAARESGRDAAEVPRKTADSVTATLHHNHLPRLDDAGLVTYDAAERTVTDVHLENGAPIPAPDDDAERLPDDF